MELALAGSYVSIAVKIAVATHMLINTFYLATTKLRQDCWLIFLHNQQIKTHGHVSAAKKAVWRASVLFTGTANSPFSTPRISITTRLISIKFTYFMPYIYVTLHTKFERNRPSSSRDVFLHENCPMHFLHLFVLLCTVLQR